MSTEMQKNSTEDMLKAANAVIEKSVKYIAETQVQLDKVAAEKQAYQAGVQATVNTMIERGLITPAESVKLAAQLSANPLMGLKLAERLASQVSADSLGKKANVKLASGTRLDAFEALVLNGDPANKETRSPGMVE